MNLQQALMLVRKKYMEEQKSITSEETAARYERARKEYPATMITAHHLWALELAKSTP